MSLAGAIADARKSATRVYINNFADKDRQNTIDVLLVWGPQAMRSEKRMILCLLTLWSWFGCAGETCGPGTGVSV